MYNQDWGYVFSSESQKLRQALTSIDVNHVPFNKRRRKKREKLEYVLLAPPTSIQTTTVGGSKDFFQFRSNVKMHVQVRFTVAYL